MKKKQSLNIAFEHLSEARRIQLSLSSLQSIFTPFNSWRYVIQNAAIVAHSRACTNEWRHYTMGAMRRAVKKYTQISIKRSDLNVLDFVVNRFIMKLFRTNNIGMVKECQSYFSFQLLSEMLKQRTGRFDMKFKRLSASWL